eukprot:1066250-Rhodomonas_salina.1
MVSGKYRALFALHSITVAYPAVLPGTGENEKQIPEYAVFSPFNLELGNKRIGIPSSSTSSSNSIIPKGPDVAFCCSVLILLLLRCTVKLSQSKYCTSLARRYNHFPAAKIDYQFSLLCRLRTRNSLLNTEWAYTCTMVIPGVTTPSIFLLNTGNLTGCPDWSSKL